MGGPGRLHCGQISQAGARPRVEALIAGSLGQDAPAGEVRAAALISAGVMITAVVLAGYMGLLDGAGAVVALIFGYIAGGVAADALASRRWGPARSQY